jgi:amino acid transporter
MVRAGVRGGITAAGQGLALAGLAAGGLILLAIWPFLVALSFGAASHASLPTGQRTVTAIVLVVGALVLAWILALPIALGVRSLARQTRQLMGSWTGRPMIEPYQPPPRPGQLSRRERLLWLAFDPATWRDLAWALLSPVASIVLGPCPPS